MNNELLISIIIPVYNSEKYLEKCLCSILNQTYNNLEIICINDGSSDKSLEILMKYSSIDKRIKVINKENEGVSIARNRALNEVCGKYVMFVDSDDWIEKNTCEVAFNAIYTNNSDLVMWSYIREWDKYSRIKKIFDEDLIIFSKEECKRQLHRRMIGLLDKELNQLENADALCTVWGKLYKTSIIKENGILFEDIRNLGTYEDGLFNLHVLEFVNNAVFLNKGLYHYRKTNSSSITKIYKENLFNSWLNLFEIMKEYIETRNLPREYRRALDNRICLSILGLGLNICESNNSALWKIKEIKRIINLRIYREAYSRLNLNNLSYRWKVFYGLAKYNCAVSIYVILVIIRRVIGRE